MDRWEKRVSYRSFDSSFVLFVFDLCIEKLQLEKSWNIQRAQLALLFLSTLSVVTFTAICTSQDFGICFRSTVVQISALCLRRENILDTLWLVHYYLLAHCDDSGLKSPCVCISHSFTASLIPSLCGYRRRISFTAYQSKYNAMNRWNLRLRNSQVTSIPPEWNLSRNMMGSSLPAHPITSDLFCRLSKWNLSAGGT